MKFLVLVITFMSLGVVWAQDCPTTKILPALPVQDQDGLGTCASNVASLMMQNNLGLSEAPSYLQLSMTFAGANREGFHYRDEKNRERLFNWGANTCQVIASAKLRGFCNADTMGFDFIGRTDPQQSQHQMLSALANYLQDRPERLRALAVQLGRGDRTQAELSYAQRLYRRTAMCALSMHEYVARQALARAHTEWRELIRTETNPARRIELEKLWNATFNEDGSPKPAALAAYRTFLGPGNVITASAREGSFAFIWGTQIGARVSFLPQGTSLRYQNDIADYGQCHDTRVEDDVEFLLNGNFCGPAPETLPREYLTQARELISQLVAYGSNRLDAEGGLVNLLSPRCAEQMPRQRDLVTGVCRPTPVTDHASARTAATIALNAVCAGKVVGIDICTGVLAASTRVDSQFCRIQLPGIAEHDYHAMAMVGYRPGVLGRRQVLIQNSWGLSCPFLQNPERAVPEALRESVECEMADNMPTGRFWIDIDLLMRNATGINVYQP